jgi:hypothetical protein
MEENALSSESVQEKKDIDLEWTAPSRLFKKRDKEFFTNIGAIVFLLIVILIFAREYMFILAVLSVVFFIYVMSTVPPEEIKNKITNLGLESAGHFYRWELLGDFWFEERWNQGFMVVRPIYGAQIIILLGNVNKDKVKELIGDRIPFREEPQKNWVDNAATWLTKKVPLEKPS